MRYVGVLAYRDVGAILKFAQKEARLQRKGASASLVEKEEGKVLFIELIKIETSACSRFQALTKCFQIVHSSQQSLWKKE